MLRRQSLKHTSELEHLYKPYDFELNRSLQCKSSSTILPPSTPPSNKKLLCQSTLGSQSFLFPSSLSCKKRPDVTSSSCGGDSGFSDCESSSHHHHHQQQQHQQHQQQQQYSLDSSSQRFTRSSNLRSLRASSNPLKKHGLMVQDLPLKKSHKSTDHGTKGFKSDGAHRIKSQLSVSTNSAFTQFVKKNANYDQQPER